MFYEEFIKMRCVHGESRFLIWGVILVEEMCPGFCLHNAYSISNYWL